MAMPLRSLSSRVLLGFAAVILTFGITTGLIVAYMSQVNVEISVIRTGYLSLERKTRDLARRQEALRGYIAEDLVGESSVRRVEVRLRSLRLQREKQLKEVVAIIEGLVEVPAQHRRRLADSLDQVRLLQTLATELEPHYRALLSAPPLDSQASPADEPLRVAAVQALTAIKTGEQVILGRANLLAEHQERATSSTARNLERNELQLRRFAIGVGIGALAAGVLITLWVTIMLRPLARLREGAKRVAAGDYGSRIDERGPTEVRDLAREFNVMGRAIEERERELVRSERLAAVGKLAAMITHEVRNPLSSIALNTELLEEELGPDRGEARDLLRSITREVDRLTTITEEYLSFARLPRPKLAADQANDVVLSLVSFVRQDLASRNITIDHTLAPGLPLAQVDASQLRQCLLNLVRNASDALTDRSDGHIAIRTRFVGARVEIDVSDTGPGIPAEVRDRLFDPFFSTKQGGTGLGLSLTHQIIRDHGGEIRVVSETGRGTTFTVSVPIAPAKDVASQVPAEGSLNRPVP